MSRMYRDRRISAETWTFAAWELARFDAALSALRPIRNEELNVSGDEFSAYDSLRPRQGLVEDQPTSADREIHEFEAA